MVVFDVSDDLDDRHVGSESSIESKESPRKDKVKPADNGRLVPIPVEFTCLNQ